MVLDEPIDLGSLASIDCNPLSEKLGKENLPLSFHLSKELSLRQSTTEMLNALNSKEKMSKEQILIPVDEIQESCNQSQIKCEYTTQEENEPLTDRILNMILDSENIHSYSQVKDKIKKAEAAESIQKMLNKDIEEEQNYIDFEETQKIMEMFENRKYSERSRENRNNCRNLYTNEILSNDSKVESKCMFKTSSINLSMQTSPENSSISKKFKQKQLKLKTKYNHQNKRNYHDSKSNKNLNSECCKLSNRRKSIVNYKEDKYKRCESRNEQRIDYFKTERTFEENSYGINYSLLIPKNNKKESIEPCKSSKQTIKEELSNTLTSNVLSKIISREEKHNSLREEFEYRHNALKKILKRNGSYSVRSLNRSNCTVSTLYKKHLTRASSKHDHTNLCNILSISNLGKRRDDKIRIHNNTSDNSEIYYI